MTACVCGHSIEEHPGRGECEAILYDEDTGEEIIGPCLCVAYEEGRTRMTSRDNDKPTKRYCSICRREGHNKASCPERKAKAAK